MRIGCNEGDRGHGCQILYWAMRTGGSFWADSDRQSVRGVRGRMWGQDKIEAGSVSPTEKQCWHAFEAALEVGGKDNVLVNADRLSIESCDLSGLFQRSVRRLARDTHN